MKPLILKLGLLVFTVTFLVGTVRDLPVFTTVFRAFVVFLAFEGILVLMTVIFIKLTESLRQVDEEESEDTFSLEEVEEDIG